MLSSFQPLRAQSELMCEIFLLWVWQNLLSKKLQFLCRIRKILKTSGNSWGNDSSFLPYTFLMTLYPSVCHERPSVVSDWSSTWWYTWQLSYLKEIIAAIFLLLFNYFHTNAPRNLKTKLSFFSPPFPLESPQQPSYKQTVCFLEGKREEFIPKIADHAVLIKYWCHAGLFLFFYF